MTMRSNVSVSSPARLCDFERGRINECSFALNELHRALFRELAESAGQLLDDALFPAAKFGEIDFRLGEFDAPVLRLMRFFEQLGDVQQRLRRNAAAIEADAARDSLPDR